MTQTLTARPYQTEALDRVAHNFFGADIKSNRQLVVLPTGCHAKGQGILRHDGYVDPVEEIGVGTRLAGPDGTPRTVLKLIRGHGKMYQIVPVKGEPWIVNEDHVLTLVRAPQGSAFPSERGGVLVDVSVKDYLKWSQTKKHIYKLFRVPVEFAPLDKPLSIDPYFLGVLLGDGSIKNNIAVHSGDSAVKQACISEAAVRNIGLRVEYGRGCSSPYFSCEKRKGNSLLADLRALGLYGTDSGTKFIPHCYKTASPRERLALLAGLMDTDGMSTGTGFDFISKSHALANDVAYVARSVGLAAYVTSCAKSCQTGVTGQYYRVGISGRCDMIPVRIPRKAARPRRQKKDALRTGFTVKSVGEGLFYGFVVDGDNRYLLDDFTVTHNCGKTVVVALSLQHPQIKGWLQQFPPDERRALFLAHREELLDQAATKIKLANPHLTVEIEQADRHASATADVVVASVQTLAPRDGKRMQKFNAGDFRVVIIDEAHHATANSYQSILQYFDMLPPSDYLEDQRPARTAKPEDVVEWQRRRLDLWDSEHDPQRLLIGITATPKRSDNVGLEAIFQRIAFSMDMRRAIEDGWLSRLRAIKVESSTDLDRVHTLAGDFNVGELGDAVNSDERNRLAVAAWHEHASGRKTIAFCANVGHAHSLAEEFRKTGVTAEAVDGTTPTEERRQLLKDFSAGKIEVLTNFGILTEGFDEPNVRCILHARPTKSSLLYIQMTGRGTRLAPGKTDCLIIDIVDVTRRHSLVTIPDLFGLPAGFDMKGGDVLNTVKRVEEIKKEVPWVQIDENVGSLDELEVRAMEVDLWDPAKLQVQDASASFNWLKDGDDTFRLSYPVEDGDAKENERLEIRRNTLGQWDISTVRDGKRPVGLSTGMRELSDAFRAAESWFRCNRHKATRLVSKAEPWRQEAPTDAQMRLLRRLLPGMSFDESKLTRGQVTDMISFQSARQAKKSKFSGLRRPSVVARPVKTGHRWRHTGTSGGDFGGW